MKSIGIFLLALSACSTYLNAQEIPTPDYSARPYYLKPDNTLQNLERTDAQSDTKIKSAGFGGYEMYFTSFGTSSAVRFNAAALPRIIIKLEPNMDPSETITLVKAEIKKDRRRFLQGSRSMSGAARNVAGAEVNLQFKKIRDGIFEIIIPNTIASGEYAFMPMGDQNISITSVANIKISCFGIDGGSANSTEATNNTAATNSTGRMENNTTIPQPDFDNVIYFFNTTDNALIDLERAINTKSENAFGFLNFKDAVSVKNTTSPVSVPVGQQEFIVRLTDATDPYTLIELMPCNPNTEKQTREYSPVKKKDHEAQTTIALKLKRISGNTYTITPIQKLNTGEYLFVNKALKEKSIFGFKVSE